MWRCALPILLLISGCSNSRMASFNGDAAKGEWALEEVRIELGDVKHALNATQVELRLLEEKVSRTKEVGQHFPASGGAREEDFAAREGPRTHLGRSAPDQPSDRADRRVPFRI